MSWLLLAILSHFLFAIVFVLDKVLVKKLFSPINYAMIIGALEGLVIILIPFVGFSLPGALTMALALLSGACFIFGIYFYFRVLSKHETTWVVPFLFGVLVPIITFILGRAFLGETLGFFQIIAFASLLFGGLILSLGKGHDIRAFFLLAVAGAFISLELTFLKMVFGEVNFFSGYILSRIGGFLTAAAIFVFLHFRRQEDVRIGASVIKDFTPTPSIVSFYLIKFYILKVWGFIFSSLGSLAFAKQALSAISNFILIYAVSLGSLTLVNGMGGIRYAFVLIIALFISQKWPHLMGEPTGFFVIVKKIIAIFFIIFGVLILLIQPSQTPGAKIWGADFSALYARELGLDSREVFTAMIGDLKIKNFRLNAHWSQIEKQKGQFDFSELDFQIDTASKAGGQIILALGERLPRWPECHIPDWAREFPATEFQFPHYDKTRVFQEAMLKYIETTINHYKNNPAIVAWQVENEPFLIGFGECPYVDDEFLEKEIALAREIGEGRPIILTDSGEFGLWFRAYKRADIFGTTMYRVVLSKAWPFGYFKYPLEPDFFRTKVAIMEMIWGKKPIIGIELQAEPWLAKRPPNIALEEQLRAFSLEQFKENIDYARQVGFEQNYLWGAEWWYWMKKTQGHPEFWEEARKLYNE